MKNNKINVGIFGFGRIGKIHYKNLASNPNVNVKTVADPFFENTNDEYGDTVFVKDGQDIIDDAEIQAVYICSPTDSHITWINEAAKAGKDIFCEKPISFSDEETLAAYEVVKENNVKFQLGVNRRFDPNFSTVKGRIKDGAIGETQLLSIVSRDPEAPPISYVEKSGGLFFDMMIHDFDMARFIVGSEVSEVYATGDALINSDIKEYSDVDTAVVTLKFQNGAIGTITNSRQAVYGYDQRLEVFGSKGAVEVSNETNDRLKISTEEGIQSSKPMYFFLERYEKAYVVEDLAFIEAILNDTETPVGFIDGIMAQRLAFAANKSLKNNSPVKVEEFKG